jgi:diguanylate cyclase (GGDEF)-like protein
MTSPATIPDQRLHGTPLWAFTLLMLLAVGAWSAWGAYTDYHNVMEQEYRLLEVRARQREARISGSLRSVNLILGSIIDDLRDPQAKSVADKNQSLKHYLRQLPELRSLLITDATGIVVAAINEKVVGFDARDREYVKVHRDAPTDDGFHISRPFKTITGVTATTLSRVIRDSKGRFAGVAVATLESGFFDEALKHSAYEPGVQSLLINQQGDIINGAPRLDNVGKNLRGGIAYAEHTASGQMTTRHLNVTKLAPAMKMAIFHDLPNAPLTVVVSREYDSVMGDWRLSMYSHLGSFILLAVATLFLAVLAGRRQKSLLRSQRQLASQLAEISALQTRLQEEVIRDPLTGLYNRRYLTETLPRELSRAKREDYPLALIMIDLDHFKRVNDSYGHAAGDEVLKNLSAILGDGAREGDIVCRYGGEEFLVALPGMSLDLALQRVEAWRLEFAATNVRQGSLTIDVTLSAGIAGFPEHGTDIDILLLRADEALYRAKKEGRNRVSCFGRTE